MVAKVGLGAVEKLRPAFARVTSMGDSGAWTPWGRLWCPWLMLGQALSSLLLHHQRSRPACHHPGLQLQGRTEPRLWPSVEVVGHG